MHLYSYLMEYCHRQRIYTFAGDPIEFNVGHSNSSCSANKAESNHVLPNVDPY